MLIFSNKILAKRKSHMSDTQKCTPLENSTQKCTPLENSHKSVHHLKTLTKVYTT